MSRPGVVGDIGIYLWIFHQGVADIDFYLWIFCPGVADTGFYWFLPVNVLLRCSR